MARRRSRARKLSRKVSLARLPTLGTSTVSVVVCTLGMGGFYLAGMGWASLACGVLGGFVLSTRPRRRRNKPAGRIVATTRRRVRKPVQRAYVSRAQRRKRKTAEVLRGKVKAGTVRVTRDVRCSFKCRASRAPRRWCRCECGGRSHGELRGGRRILGI